jgi:hypothetical protein
MNISPNVTFDLLLDKDAWYRPIGEFASVDELL